jgi:hypothetical protein
MFGQPHAGGVNVPGAQCVQNPQMLAYRYAVTLTLVALAILVVVLEYKRDDIVEIAGKAVNGGAKVGQWGGAILGQARRLGRPRAKRAPHGAVASERPLTRCP